MSQTASGEKFTVPTTANDAHSQVAAKMNSYRKVVFSRTLDAAKWENSEVRRAIDPKEIARMKEAEGKDIFISGSGSVASAFAKLGLIDEYRIWLNPVILGGGRPLFGILPDRKKLKLVGLKRFGSGLVSLTYHP